MEKTKEELLSDLEKILDELHRYQIDKSLIRARQIRPELTGEDILNPDDFPDLISDPLFTYEDGMAAGVLSAKMAVRAWLIKNG